jgi:parvulin-like peptidyl-prolyl isomerase
MPRRIVRLAAWASIAGVCVGATLVDRVVATVNDVAIPESALRRAVRLSALSPQPNESREAFRDRVLEALIEQQLQYEEALRFGPAPPDAAEVDAALAKLRDRLRAAGKDPAEEFERAGMTVEDVRASLERQLVVQRYLRERFRPVALADEDRARAEYSGPYTAERGAANLPVPPFEAVADEMRARAQQRVFEEEVGRWSKDLREKARVVIYRTPPPGEAGPPTVLSTAPAARATSAPTGQIPAVTRTPVPNPTG